jgi:hypothetical protein
VRRERSGICSPDGPSGNVPGVKAPVASIGLLVAVVSLGVRVDAHRLDEYLQATRVSIDLDRVTLEIDLTAGASLAAKVVGWMDQDRDGEFSSNERSVYAQQVIDSVTLTLDGQPGRVTLIDSTFPEPGEMAEGVGTIRLRAAATMRKLASGRHVLTLFNAHHPEVSVYLANVLVPADKRITIASQRRDPAQQTLTLDYDVASGIWPSIVLATLVLALLGFRSYGRFFDRGRRATMRASAPSSRA